ncbi:MAG: TfoX/Sxy family protein [Lachnospiraceae bacterium]|nr:TfoX/Sxy family protein [Lachnospiraceae bacterium]
MSELTSMMNIGKEMAKKLTAVGIDSPEKLMDLGAKQAFVKLKQTYPQVCLVHLYTLEGAIHNLEFNNLSEDKKKELKEFSDFLKG